jgi:hypothetical protein
MIFKSEAKRVSVMNPATGLFIADFVDGSFETNDESVIEELKRQGYEPQQDSIEEIQPDVPAVIPVEEKKAKRTKK